MPGAVCNNPLPLSSIRSRSKGRLMTTTMLRSLSRAGSSYAPLRVHPTRIQKQPLQAATTTCLVEGRYHQRRYAGIHAISNPTLAGIEKRWEGMPPQEQANLWMALRDRMKTDWHEMTLQEKKAGTYPRVSNTDRPTLKPYTSIPIAVSSASSAIAHLFASFRD